MECTHDLRYFHARRDGHQSDDTVSDKDMGSDNGRACARRLADNDRGVSMNTNKTVTHEQAELIIGQFPDTWSGRRYRLACTIMYVCSLRISEVTGLRRSDLTDDGRLIVKRLKQGSKLEKGKLIEKVKVTEFPLPDDIYDELREWSDSLPASCKWLFPTRTQQRTNRSVMYRAMRSAAESVGVDGFHPHMFRHSGITNMMQLRDDSGAPVFDLHEVQHLAGHANIATTSQYLHVNSERLREKMRMVRRP